MSGSRASKRVLHEEPSPVQASGGKRSQLASLFARDGYAGRILNEATPGFRPWGQRRADADEDAVAMSTSEPAVAEGDSSVLDPLGHEDESSALDPNAHFDIQSDDESSSEDDDSLEGCESIDEVETTTGNEYAFFQPNKLCTVINTHMLCRHCRQSVVPVDSTVTMSHKSIGGACIRCNAKEEHDKRRSTHEWTMTPDPVSSKKQDGKDRDHKSIGHYEINWILTAAMHVNGLGWSHMSKLFGMLGIGVAAFSRKTQRQMEKELGDAEISVSDDIMLENMMKEMALSEKEDDYTDDNGVVQQGRHLIDLSIDMGWQSRSSGKKYDSISGHMLGIGAQTGNIAAYVLLSKLCAICQVAYRLGILPREHECTANYEGSSKAMECVAALQIAVSTSENLYNGKKARVSRFITDDDSSMRSYVKHSYAQRQLLPPDHPNHLKAEDWPRTLKNHKKKDNGKLPLHIEEPKWLSDPNHRTKCYAAGYFKLLCGKETKKLITMADCLRMKRNFGYCQKMSRDKPFDEFVKAFKAVLEHHFNNHTYCGDWCPHTAARASGEEDPELIASKYRCKIKDAELWALMLAVHNKYTTIDMLRDIWHHYHSQKNEAMNKSITAYSPKDRVYSKSKSLRYRICVAIGVNSVGMEEYWSTVFGVVGVKVSPTMRKSFARVDREETSKRECQKSPAVKAKRAADNNRKISKQVKEDQEAYKRGATYRSGVAVEEEQEQPEEDGRKPAAVRCCKHCGSTSHQRISSSKCPANPKNTGAVAGAASGLVAEGMEAETQQLGDEGKFEISRRKKIFVTAKVYVHLHDCSFLFIFPAKNLS